ncbi:type II toxin-antitoxin system PemK/MazF family toxin [Azospirillum sp.]|uniref:type II toxin-antitoxin system PemK/MazF family toxin n=1 Tax=Azospirillum sp. TaxID=34012 RepID=UPI002D741204|nr:type II toxin-antitoxin system PemK/MazF family toxin [Azospirillum sp.]HYD65984.1 type II toxin-antitoxin system PemK/MazF family toxin [Azospirillum sp.]
MFEFGSIVFTRFPFTDLSGGKLRPALVVSRDNGRRADVVLAFITSNTSFTDGPDARAIAPTAMNGLKVPSVVRFDKLVTLEKRVVSGKLGDAEPGWLHDAAPVFCRVFGFTLPAIPES